ncbi:expressed unknown protein [Seminavis robusta]|uniref:VWFD domain-containing protein n=1 Tax=Seminavis robusta TaxID=568900 RepID=A0A9N8EG89_9STRA|nr:expressed unknown protein [Seminavis robusta]|eukprot:Sro954_g224310.1 n/a (1212) ;mRNA; r:14798-19706
MKFLATSLLLASMASWAQADMCVKKVMDFDGLERGTYVTNQFKDDFGATISCKGGKDNSCRIFDTAVPYGHWPSGSCRTSKCKIGSCSNKNGCGDPDLGAPNKYCPGGGPGEGDGGKPGKKYENCQPLGNILIVDENGPDKPPDDAVGGNIYFKFDNPIILESGHFLDVDGYEETFIIAKFCDGGQVKRDVDKLGDNGYGKLDLSDITKPVCEVEVEFSGSGSFSSLEYDYCAQCEPVECPGSGVMVTPTDYPACTPECPSDRSPGPDPVCIDKVMDFEGLDRGTYVTNQFKDDFGATISCKGGKDNSCRIFDTAIPYGHWPSGSCRTSECSLSSCSNKNGCGDPDLGAPNRKCPDGGPGSGGGGEPGKKYENCQPLGNVLIVDENGPGKPPDDAVGGNIYFKFDNPIVLASGHFLDVDDYEETFIIAKFCDGGQVKRDVDKLGDNGYGKLDLSDITKPVCEVEVEFSGSGSFSSLEYALCGECEPVECPGSGVMVTPTNFPACTPECTCEAVECPISKVMVVPGDFPDCTPECTCGPVQCPGTDLMVTPSDFPDCTPVCSCDEVQCPGTDVMVTPSDFPTCTPECTCAAVECPGSGVMVIPSDFPECNPVCTCGPVQCPGSDVMVTPGDFPDCTPVCTCDAITCPTGETMTPSDFPDCTSPCPTECDPVTCPTGETMTSNDFPDCSSPCPTECDPITCPTGETMTPSDFPDCTSSCPTECSPVECPLSGTTMTPSDFPDCTPVCPSECSPVECPDSGTMVTPSDFPDCTPECPTECDPVECPGSGVMVTPVDFPTCTPECTCAPYECPDGTMVVPEDFPGCTAVCPPPPPTSCDPVECPGTDVMMTPSDFPDCTPECSCGACDPCPGDMVASQGAFPDCACECPPPPTSCDPVECPGTGVMVTPSDFPDCTPECTCGACDPCPGDMVASQSAFPDCGCECPAPTDPVITDFWSSAEIAVLKLGEETLEIQANAETDEWLFINGEPIMDFEDGKFHKTELAGSLVRYKQSSPGVREANIYLYGDDHERMQIKTYKSFVRVDVNWIGNPDDFKACESASSIPPKWLKFFFRRHAQWTQNQSIHLHDVLQQACQLFPQARCGSSPFFNDTECYTCLSPSPALTDDGYADGNFIGCRALHSTFPLTNPENRCAHVALDDTLDPMGKFNASTTTPLAFPQYRISLKLFALETIRRYPPLAVVPILDARDNHRMLR